jgi:tetratricopeptide (TPR) repeat protein
MTDVFAIQDEIGQAISEALQVRLTPRTRTVNLEAYQLYLKGQYHKNRITPESLAKAKDCFEQAAAIDPNCAPAYSGLGVYYYMLAFLGFKPVREMAPLVKSAAEKAVAIDPVNSEAHSLLAIMAAVFDYDWKAAETHHRKAMSAEPVPTLARYRYAGCYLVPLGRFVEAIEQSRSGLDTDPLSTVLHFGMCLSMICARQYQEAMEWARRALELDANLYPLWRMIGRAKLGLGLAQEAATSLERFVELAPWDSSGRWLLAVAYDQSGDRERGRECARKLAGPSGHTAGDYVYYAAAGEVDAMFEALDAAFERRDFLLSSVQRDPFFDPYRADPRWQALLRRLNLAHEPLTQEPGMETTRMIKNNAEDERVYRDD